MVVMSEKTSVNTHLCSIATSVTLQHDTLISWFRCMACKFGTHCNSRELEVLWGHLDFIIDVRNSPPLLQSALEEEASGTFGPER